MDQSNTQVDQQARSGPAEPRDAGQPVGPRHLLHGPVVAHPHVAGAATAFTRPGRRRNLGSRGAENATGLLFSGCGLEAFGLAAVGEGTSDHEIPLPDVGVTAHEVEKAGLRRRTPVRQSINYESVLRLLEEQQHCCALSGRPLTPEAAALDHILPICRGGQHVIENAQVLHKEVNRAKGTLTNEEFIRLCEQVIAHQTRNVRTPSHEDRESSHPQHPAV